MTYHVGVPVGSQAMVVQLCQSDRCSGRRRVGFIESSRGGRGAGVSDVDVSIRDICG